MLARRNTKQKNIIYEAVLDLRGHVSAEEVYLKVSKDHPTISKATVYRNLNVLSNEGKIRKIEPSSLFTERRFDFTLMQHSHAICKNCGKIIDVYVENEGDLENKAKPREDGFLLTSHELIFEGICKECRAKENKNGTERIKN